MGHVIPFDRSRFTRGDLEDFDKFAAPLLKSRLWQGVIRYTAVGKSDWIGVYLPGDERPSLNFARHQRGPHAGKYVLYHDPHDVPFREAGSLKALLESFGEQDHHAA